MNTVRSPIVSKDQWPQLPIAERVSESDARLYAFGKVPAMDARDEDYVFMLTVHTADPVAEQQLAALCSRAVSSVPIVLKAMTSALMELEDVGKRAGETRDAANLLRRAIAELSGEPSGAARRPQVV